MLPQRKTFRPFLLVVISILIILKIVALTPTSLEEVKPIAKVIDPQTLVEQTEELLAPGIPRNRIAEYTVEKFNYVSVQNGIKQWRIEADKAYMYHPEKLVHSRQIKALLFDPEGHVTQVTGKEAKYFMNHRDLEVFGNVKTLFPDGFELHSEYLHYKPAEQYVKIPTKYLAQGAGREMGGRFFKFISFGLDYDMKSYLIQLHKNVKVTLEGTQGAPSKGAPSNDETVIESDHCLINRNRQLAHFTMDPKRPLNKRFVHITQPSLFARSRRADMNYGSNSSVLEYMTAYDDVLIKEKNKQKLLRYSTSGRADFNHQQNVIILTQFPQVYQDEDTVTGDMIILHRDTDVVEIEHSNAFSQGLNHDQ